jgi:hypothetical protein
LARRGRSKLKALGPRKTWWRQPTSWSPQGWGECHQENRMQNKAKKFHKSNVWDYHKMWWDNCKWKIWLSSTTIPWAFWILSSNDYKFKAWFHTAGGGGGGDKSP